MKKKSIVVSLILFICSLASCSSGVKEEPGGYIDILPSTSESGVILHAFNWTFAQIEENLPAIKNAGYKSIQTSPVQQPKSGGASWWSYYQPVSLSIATSSPLGSKEDLTSLCTAADSLGINIICDIVFNHMANVNDTTLESDGTPTVAPEVGTYESYIYEHRNDSSSPTFHHNPNATGSGAVTQVYTYGKLPDLNTSNIYVQARCLSLLKECIDVGVDGFRFDAAKHIETPTDPQYSSDFWTNVLGEAKTYYHTKTNQDLFAYGEILNDPDGNRDISAYTSFMKVTDNTYCSKVISGSASNNATTVSGAQYGKTTDASNLITWVESHDTYIDASSHSGDRRTAQRWAVVASRKDTNPLFFARPDDNNTVANIGSYFFEDETIACLNRFHNRFIGASEEQSASDSIYANERYNDTSSGAIIVNFAGSGSKTVSFSHLGTGVYYNQITGESVTVTNNKAKITFDANGIVVLTKSKNLPHPTIAVNKLSTSFTGTIDVTITVTNASSAYYTINDGEQVPFTNTASLTLGSVVNDDNNVILDIYVSNSQFSSHKTYTYAKISVIAGYFNVVNLKSAYYTDYALYYWAWNGSSSCWFNNYTIQDGIILIDFSNTTYTGFLLGVFAKGHVISNPTVWDTSIIKQSGDISVSATFYNASNF